MVAVYLLNPSNYLNIFFIYLFIYNIFLFQFYDNMLPISLFFYWTFIFGDIVRIVY